MPFDFKAYDAKCNGLTPEELQREWEHYTRLISGASTSTAVSGLAVPFTMGVSTIGVAMAAPAIHNARKKREIIEKHLQKHNATHVTRKRDVLGSMAVSGTIGVVTLGVGTMGADAVATAGAEHGISAVVENELAIKVVTHAALDGVGMGIEHAHTNHLKKKDAVKAFHAAGVFKAVENAKAAEAGYSIQPYNPQNFASGSSMAYMGSPPPPPPYSPNLPRPPSYYGSSTPMYPSNSKTSAIHSQSSHASQFASQVPPGLFTTPQPYDPTQIQIQQTSQSGATSITASTAPTQISGSYSTNPVNPTYSQPMAQNTPTAPALSSPAIQQLVQGQNVQSQYQPGRHMAMKSENGTGSSYNPSPQEDVYNMRTVSESLPSLGLETDTALESKQQVASQKSDNSIAIPQQEQQRVEVIVHSPSVPYEHPIDHDNQSCVPSATLFPSVPQYQTGQLEIQTQSTVPGEHHLVRNTGSGTSVSSPVNSRRIETPQYSTQHSPPRSFSPQFPAADKYYAGHMEQTQDGNVRHELKSPAHLANSELWKHSLQAPPSPRPLPRYTQQPTPIQSPGIPYFPPPPGQQGNSYSPVAAPVHGTSHQQGFGQIAMEVQYPPVPIPSPYGAPTPSTSYQGMPPVSGQQQQHTPISSYPKQQQQAMAAQYHAAGYTPNPLTPPYSPPQTTQHIGSSYFPGGEAPQYQTMYHMPHS